MNNNQIFIKKQLNKDADENLSRPMPAILTQMRPGTQQNVRPNNIASL